MNKPNEDRTLYLFHIANRYITNLSNSILGLPPLVFILGDNCQNFSLMEWQIFLILEKQANPSISTNQEIEAILKDQFKPLTLPGKSYLAMTFSNFFTAGRTSGVVSR